jgi:hypothetical protein
VPDTELDKEHVRMKLPNSARAIIAQEKLTDYLLSAEHPRGSSKAKFFLRRGFSVEQSKQFAEALKSHAQTHEIAEQHPSEFGIRYVVEGDLDTPSGTNTYVRTIWYIAYGEVLPRLVTAYPIKRGSL